MSNCIVRVELHYAKSPEQYVRLHAEMAANRLFNTIRGSDGKTYQLPPAEYRYEGTATPEQVREIAKQCANRVDSSNAVVVSETNVVLWNGLKLH